MHLMSLVKYTIIDGNENQSYNILLSPQDYEQALSDSNYAAQILENIKKSGLNSQKKKLGIVEEVNVNKKDESNKENNLNEETSLDDSENVETAIWSRNATLLFLDLYQEYAPSIDKGKCSQKHAFQEISKKLAEKNYLFLSKQCMTKLTSMKRMYKKIKDHNSKSGNDRQTWQYYEQMEEIFGSKPWMKPVCTETSTPNDSAEETISDEPASKRTKLCTVVDKHLQKMLELKEQSRQDKKEHHESTMRRLDTLNDILKTIIDKEAKK